MSEGKQSGFRNWMLSASALRMLMNLWPPFLGAGISVERIAPDFSSARIKMTLRWYNRNYVGTHYGGSLFSMTDAFFAILAIHQLGREYVVWDKYSSIDYLAPGKGVVTADFVLPDGFVAEVLKRTADGGKYEPILTTTIYDTQGVAIATVEKKLHIRKAKPINAAPSL